MKKNNFLAILGIGLLISLSINLFMAGLVVGTSVNAAHKPDQAGAAQDRKMRETLSDADKLVLKQAMDVDRAKITQLHTDVENMKADIRELLKKDHLDEKALNAVLEAEKAKKLAMVHMIYKARQAAMQKMSPAGQAILAQVSRLGYELEPLCR